MHIVTYIHVHMYLLHKDIHRYYTLVFSLTRTVTCGYFQMLRSLGDSDYVCKSLKAISLYINKGQVRNGKLYAVLSE